MGSAERKDRDDSLEDPVISRIDFVGKDVVEIGCGTGAFTLEHLRHANSVLCIDPDHEAVERLKAQWAESSQNCPLNACQGRIEDCPLPQESFDVAVFSDSL